LPYPASTRSYRIEASIGVLVPQPSPGPLLCGRTGAYGSRRTGFVTAVRTVWFRLRSSTNRSHSKTPPTPIFQFVTPSGFATPSSICEALSGSTSGWTRCFTAACLRLSVDRTPSCVKMSGLRGSTNSTVSRRVKTADRGVGRSRVPCSYPRFLRGRLTRRSKYSSSASGWPFSNGDGPGPEVWARSKDVAKKNSTDYLPRMQEKIPAKRW
jgi:hypothetical protein